MNQQQLSNNISGVISTIDPMVNLTIKISNSSTNSPTLISPASSAFYSALQSPYISPRATIDDSNPPSSTTTTTTTTTTTPTTPLSSTSDDIPSTSYNFSDPTKHTLPRISFSFPVPRISVTKGSVSPALSSKLRSCDVYIGFHGKNPNLTRFCKWVRSELELQGIACFVADRSNYADTQSHEVADRVICSVSFGVVVVTKYSLLNYLVSEEIRFFGQKKNLIPVFFDTNLNEVADLLDGKDCKEAIELLMKCHEVVKVEANEGNWRCCVGKTVGILKGKLGRKSVEDKESENLDEIPFCKNRFFVGRERELAEIENLFFGSGDVQENESMTEGLADEEDEDGEKERGRIRSFDEQETEAFKRIRQELFRDMPYLLIIDNLETENEWWEGKDLHDLIPRNTGSTHVIITTRLPKVMSFRRMQLQPLPLSDALMLITGRRKKEYPAQEVEILKKFDEKLGRSSFGLWVIGSLLCELTILPSALFQAINQILVDDTTSRFDEPFWENNYFLLKVLIFCITLLNGTKNHLALRMLLSGVWFAASPVSSNLLAAAASHMSPPTNRFKKWAKKTNLTLFCCSGFINSQSRKTEHESALLLVKLGLARRSNTQPGCCIMFHSITQVFAKRKGPLLAAKATIQSTRKIGNQILNIDHLWASAFLVFGYKSDPPLVQLKPLQMVQYIKKTALPLAITAFTTFSRCNSALELLKICTNALEEVEKSFVSQIEDWCHGSLCWKKKKKKKSNLNQKTDEYVWQDVTLLKATLLETRAKLLLRGGYFDYGEELCRTCISIRTVMLGHNHAQTLAAQETLSKLVRLRCKI
ncbi:putative P-loop containing nucleoside triphosphate hydrolase, TIR domain-containing protein [Helianthus annuus]|nr:putative P-loop containing nucleoside triphosphate hydrolase, TIR domain-containing protein [Helianthus annuus]